VRDATDRAADLLADLGAHGEEADPAVEDPLADFTVLWHAGAANALRHLDDDMRAQLDPGLAEVAADGARYTALDYLAAVGRRGDFGVALGRFHETYDLLVTPAAAVLPFTVGQEVPDGWPHRRWPTWATLSYPFNLTQQPAASVPCGFTDHGLPVGVQIVGRRHADALVLRAARAYEAANPMADRAPPEPAGKQAGTGPGGTR
jgi:aspartyl-tRNA(Asn)/glutamyl-tRNA(Gln) amidotransferase subunit A